MLLSTKILIVNFKFITKTLKGSEIELAIVKTIWINFYLENKQKQKTSMKFVINKNEAFEV